MMLYLRLQRERRRIYVYDISTNTPALGEGVEAFSNESVESLILKERDNIYSLFHVKLYLNMECRNMTKTRAWYAGGRAPVSSSQEGSGFIPNVGLTNDAPRQMG